MTLERRSDRSGQAEDSDTNAIRAFNGAMLADERVEVSMIPIGDGLSMPQKRWRQARRCRGLPTGVYPLVG
ncbi:MAG: hypothetical protein ACSLE5_08730 [Porticoccaceae bacterium]